MQPPAASSEPVRPGSGSSILATRGPGLRAYALHPAWSVAACVVSQPRNPRHVSPHMGCARCIPHGNRTPSGHVTHQSPCDGCPRGWGHLSFAVCPRWVRTPWPAGCPGDTRGRDSWLVSVSHALDGGLAPRHRYTQGPNKSESHCTGLDCACTGLQRGCSSLDRRLQNRRPDAPGDHCATHAAATFEMDGRRD